MISQQKKPRKYFQLIQYAGSHHKYQLIILILMIMINILQMAVMFMLPYLLHQVSYSCSDLDTQSCNQFVCKLDQSQINRFLTAKTPFYSLADELGNFRCQRSQQLITIQSLLFIGAITGMCIFSVFTEKLGRKKSMLFSMVIFLIGILIVFFSKSILILGIGIFVCFAGAQTTVQYSSCYATEVVNQKYRFKFGCSIALTDSMGIIMNSLAYYLIKNWRVVFLLFYIIPIVTVIIGIIYYIQQTPIDLLSSCKSPQILRTMEKIANMNGVNNPELNLKLVQALKTEYLSQSKTQAFNPIDLCRFKSLRTLLIPLIIANFFCNYLFYAPSFIQKNISQDIFWDNIISGVSKMVSVIFVYYSLTSLQRKKVILVLSISIFVLSLLMALDVFRTVGLFKIVIYFIFRMKVSVLQSVTYTSNYETFPAQVRATAAIICYIAGEASGIVQPWTNKIAQNIKLPYSYFFAIFGFANIINSFFLRETYGVAPPEIIQQLQQQRTPQPNQSKQDRKKVSIKES